MAGRPPIYNGDNPNDIKKVQELCLSYFKGIDLSGVNKDGVTTTPPTVTGLTLHLGFADKSSLYDYAKNSAFSHSIKKAITTIEMYHEIKAAHGDKCTGNIFVLKNFGWKDSQAVEHSGEVKGNSPKIIFTDVAKNNAENQ